MLGRNGTGLTYHLLVQWRCGVVPAFGCVARVTQRPPLAPHAAHHHFVSGEYLQEQGVLSRSKHSLELKSGTINPLTSFSWRKRVPVPRCRIVCNRWPLFGVPCVPALGVSASQAAVLCSIQTWRTYEQWCCQIDILAVLVRTVREPHSTRVRAAAESQASVCGSRRLPSVAATLDARM